MTGTDALSYAYDRCGEIATVNTDGLRVREAADTNSKALEVADQARPIRWTAQHRHRMAGSQ